MTHLSRVIDRKTYSDPAAFYQDAREAGLSRYQKLTRDALSAATWLRRYAEALLKDRAKSESSEAKDDPGMS
jgi:hypothetical protein